MLLSSLLEDKRYVWQEATQKQILSRLLCQSHRYKTQGQKNEKLVMVFGKSHAGKTTFILSLMGVAEDKLSELNLILRAGIPEGKSSTSTAIIYQKSDDDCFGICEHSINDVSSYNTCKCSEEEFVKKIQATRTAVESHKRGNEVVLFLYIPRYYFDDNTYNNWTINILDVPGYETTNSEERLHTEAILNKYMSVSALNIVVRSIYDINDLQYFKAPNRDDFTKLTSDRYIIVTTRTYSQESIFKYFMQPQNERKVSFEEMLNRECDEQFKRVFGTKLPTYFPIDLGESFYELINTKITNSEDREYLIDYRKRVFKNIYQCIYSKQSTSLVSWVREVLEDEDYYGSIELSNVEKKIQKVKEYLELKNAQLHKRNGHVQSLEQRCSEVNEKINKLVEKREILKIPDMNTWIDDEVAICKEQFFTKDYKWIGTKVGNDVSGMFAELFSKMLKDEVEKLSLEHDAVISEKIKKCWLNEVSDAEIEIRNNLNEDMYAHLFLKILNPSNKEKIEIGKKRLCMTIPNLLLKIYGQIQQGYDLTLSQIRSKELNKLLLLIKENKKKVNELTKKISDALIEKSILEEQKKAIEQRVEKDKSIISEYQKIAYTNYAHQRTEVLDLINTTCLREEKVEYLILLCLLDKDYKKIALE